MLAAVVKLAILLTPSYTTAPLHITDRRIPERVLSPQLAGDNPSRRCLKGNSEVSCGCAIYATPTNPKSAPSGPETKPQSDRPPPHRLGGCVHWVPGRRAAKAGLCFLLVDWAFGRTLFVKEW